METEAPETKKKRTKLVRVRAGEKSEKKTKEAAEDWMAELHLAAKREEEKLMATLFQMPAGCDGDVLASKRPKTALQMEAAAAEGETKPARKTKMVRVKQEYIDWLVSRGPPRPFVGLSDERIDKVPCAALRAKMRVVYREAAEHMRALRARDADILEQYRSKGYAEVEEEIPEEEVEVRDDDGDGMEQVDVAAAAIDDVGAEPAGVCKL